MSPSLGGGFRGNHSEGSLMLLYQLFHSFLAFLGDRRDAVGLRVRCLPMLVIATVGLRYILLCDGSSLRLTKTATPEKPAPSNTSTRLEHLDERAYLGSGMELPITAEGLH